MVEQLIEDQRLEGNVTYRGKKINAWRGTFSLCVNPVEKNVPKVSTFRIPL
jgi:hypothetical protein